MSSWKYKFSRHLCDLPGGRTLKTLYLMPERFNSRYSSQVRAKDRHVVMCLHSGVLETLHETGNVALQMINLTHLPESFYALRESFLWAKPGWWSFCGGILWTLTGQFLRPQNHQWLAVQLVQGISDWSDSSSISLFSPWRWVHAQCWNRMEPFASISQHPGFFD